MLALKILFYWLAAVNLLAFCLGAFDKYRAKHGGRRIRESILLLTAVLGGGVGLYLCMTCLRHKTRKLKFMLGVPLILLMQALLLWFLPGLL